MSDNPANRLTNQFCSSVRILADPSFCGLLEVLLGRLSKLVPVMSVRLETSLSGYAIQLEMTWKKNHVFVIV